MPTYNQRCAKSAMLVKKHGTKQKIMKTYTKYAYMYVNVVIKFHLKDICHIIRVGKRFKYRNDLSTQETEWIINARMS